MSIEQVVNAVDTTIHKLPYMESVYRQVKDQVEKMQRTVQLLANDIAALERKISILDKIAFSSEQECKRTEQRTQELTTQKDILEKWIANLLDGEGYSKLTQLVKESVKAVLSENKQVILVSFAAIIQTLKDDPELIKLIYNMPTANTEYKDNSNNVTKYLESHKDGILYLAEKHYENLVNALTNNVINTVATSLPNPSLSLPSSSITFPNTSDQCDNYRRKEPF